MDVNKQLLDAISSLIDGGAFDLTDSPKSLVSNLRRIVDEAKAIAAAEQAQQAEPVAWVRFCSDGCYEGPLMNSSPAMDGARRTSGAWTPLFAAQLVARDVLMAAMRAAVAECAEICDVYSSYKGARCASEIRHPIMNSKLADIADRYAAQPPAVAVPDGYALVPIEPTKAMCDAGDRADADMLTVQLIYRAMIDAAPKP